MIDLGYSIEKFPLVSNSENIYYFKILNLFYFGSTDFDLKINSV